VEISGKPVKEVTFTPGGVPAKVDPNGVYQVEQMYVQYFLPANEKGAYPLLLWHGGGLTGVTYETTPDGREGWLNYFLRKGWSIYNSDAVERGRAGWAQYPDIFKSEPVFLTTANPFERFRIGDVPKNIPTLFIYGDYIERDSRWPRIRATGLAFADAMKAAGGSVDVVELPKVGIKGNSHMMMMDKNNGQVASLIQNWLEGKGLTKKP